MAENKFIKHLKGEQAVGSLVEIKNQNTPASFGNMPQGTSDSNVKYSDVRGDVTVVANGTMAWKINDSALTLAPIVNGDGTDYTGKYEVSGAGLWVNSTYTFPSTGDPNHPVAMIFNPNSKWVLKLCGDNLIVNDGNTLELTVVITIGSSNIISKQFTIREQANQFCKELVIDFDESNVALIKAMGLSTMQLQVLCGTADASARIYNGMTTLTVLQRKVDAAVVSGTFANVEEVLRDGILPSDYFNNAAYIAQIEDGDSAYAVFTRDGDTVALSGWAQPIPDQTNNAGKFLTTDGSLMSWAQLTISDVDGLSTELSDLQDQIDDLSGRGRYLSIWNCTTGLAETNPPTSPYTYQSGDYFIVGTVGATNYRPDGSSYTTGVASTTVETAEVKVDDVYLYDGTNWKLLASSQRTYTFAGIAGSPYDNTNLGNALDAKANNTNRVNGAPLSNSASVFYGTSDTAAATVQKEVSIPSITTLDTGTIIIVQPTVTSTVANSTIKLNGFTAYPMRYNNAAITTSTDSIVWNAAYPSIWVFDGTYWRFVAHGIDSNTTYSTMSVSEGTTGTATSNRVLQAVNLKQIIQGTTLTGIDVVTTGAVSSTDTITEGIGKLQATKADTSVLATVATTGDYDDLLNKPTIPAAQVNSDWNANSGVAQILNKPTLATVATSGSYNDLSNKPTIPTVNNPTITITQGGVTKGSFTLNQATGDTIALDAGGGGIGNIDNLTIIANADDEIQAVAVIDQNTGIAKTWTGTMAEYEAIVTKDPETEYIITDDIGGSATEIGEITEALNDKVDKGHQVIEFQEPTALNNYTWYRKYADGWVEQGGNYDAGSYRDSITANITYPVEMANTRYTKLFGCEKDSDSSWAGYLNYTNPTTTGVTLRYWNNIGTSVRYISWQISGMAA